MTLPGQDTSPSQVNSPAMLVLILQLSGLKQSEMKCLTQELNIMVPRSGIDLVPLKYESDTLPLSYHASPYEPILSLYWLRWMYM